jgi:hypothetical protein
MNTAVSILAAILHSHYHRYIRDRQPLCICDVPHKLKIFPKKSANEVTDNRKLVAATTHRCTKSPLDSNGFKNQN